MVKLLSYEIKEVESKLRNYCTYLLGVIIAKLFPLLSFSYVLFFFSLYIILPVEIHALSICNTILYPLLC